MELIVGIGLLVVFVLCIRLFGAWMLRIDEVISLLKSINSKLKGHPRECANCYGTGKSKQGDNFVTCIICKGNGIVK